MAGTFDNLVAALGREATQKLVAAYGGTRIYVPVRAAPESAFATLIGHAAAEALSRYYGGERFDVPIAKRGQRVLRGEICRLRRDGMHVTAIARALGCTRRYVFRILADQQTAPRSE
jgi:Mor family transcriptional regulator